MNAEPVVDRRATGLGALVGLLGLALVSIAAVVVERRVDDFEHSGWIITVFGVLTLVAFGAGGWQAGKLAPAAPFSNGALAGGGAVLAWVPVRVVIWLARGRDEPLVGGTDTALPVTGLAFWLIAGSAIAAGAAWVSARRTRGRMERGGEPAGRPRPGIDPAEERPDSTGQGAG